MNPRDPTPEFLQHIQLPAASYKILMGFDAGSPWPYIRDPEIIAELNATYSLTDKVITGEKEAWE